MNRSAVLWPCPAPNHRRPPHRRPWKMSLRRWSSSFVKSSSADSAGAGPTAGSARRVRTWSMDGGCGPAPRLAHGVAAPAQCHALQCLLVILADRQRLAVSCSSRAAASGLRLGHAWVRMATQVTATMLSNWRATRSCARQQQRSTEPARGRVPANSPAGAGSSHCV